MAEPFKITEARWTDLLDLIEMGKVVPIVGRRLSMVQPDDGGPPVPLPHALADRMAAEVGLEALPSGWGLSKLYMTMAESNSYSIDAFHPKLKRVLGALKPQLDVLRQLAEITPFNLFLSTAIDGFLETAVREVRGAQGQTIVSHTFAPGHENPMRPLLGRGEVCVYNLLGSRQTCPNWAVTTEGLVEFVIGMQGEKYRPDRLFDALKDRHLLAIGCQIPDWLGRFFLRSLRQGPISVERASTFMVDDAHDADQSFGDYLALFSKRSFVVPGDAVAFTEELARRWKERAGTTQSAATAPAWAAPAAQPAGVPAQQPAAGAVFLSYSHDDGDQAQLLYEFLRSQRIDVWKDDRDDAIGKGTNWDQVINRRIADCACFVPVISRDTASTSDSYFWREWNLALDRSRQMNGLARNFIFPVLCEPGLPVPEQFEPWQWSVLSNDADRQALADGLRREQQAVRKALR